MIRLLPLCLLSGLASAAAALELSVPGTKVAAAEERHGALQLPITGWIHGAAQTLWAEGHITQEAWQLEAGLRTTLELLAPLRRALEAEGFDILFECAARVCGGFDFRYGLEVLPEPEMHVDLGDYRYAVASRPGDAQPEYVALLISRAAGTGFLQITRVAPSRNDAPALVTRAPGIALATGAPVVQTMLAEGAAVLGDLSFARGASRLEEGPFASLTALAAFLRENPKAEIVLVGHTDADGSLEANIALSRARAAAVQARLTQTHGIDPARVGAEGVGFLAPATSNLTEAGRTQNRRVEAILSQHP